MLQLKWNNRWRYSYSLFDLLYNIFWPFKFIWLNCCKYLNSLNDRYQLYSAGGHKLMKELSVISFVKMQRRLKSVVSWMMTRQQRLISEYSKRNKFSLDSDSSSSSILDMCMPKMLDNSKAKQQHSEAVGKFFDEYLHQKHTLNHLKLMQGVLTFKEMIDIKLENKNFEIENNDEQSSNKFKNLINANAIKLPKLLNRNNISAVDLINEHEEQKVNSPKSSISVSKLFQETNKDAFQYFEEIRF